MKESFENWYKRLEKTCKENDLEWILTGDAESYREEYDEGMSINEVINENMDVAAEDNLYKGSVE